MENTFLKNHKGLTLVGIIVLWYIIATMVDLLWLKNSVFSKLFVLKKAYLGTKAVDIPLPESGILLFILGVVLIFCIYLVNEIGIPKAQIFKYGLSVIGASLVLFILLLPLLVLGEIAYIILVNELCENVSWLKWLKDVLDIFSFKAEIQTSFISSPIKIDLSLGGLLALYLGIPYIIKKVKK